MSHRDYPQFDAIDQASEWLLDWSFKSHHPGVYTHSLHRYPAKFVPQIERKLILAFSDPGDVVCDPFCGSGTTLVEAILLGRDAVGIDLNPMAVLNAKTKITL